MADLELQRALRGLEGKPSGFLRELGARCKEILRSREHERREATLAVTSWPAWQPPNDMRGKLLHAWDEDGHPLCNGPKARSPESVRFSLLASTPIGGQRSRCGRCVRASERGARLGPCRPPEVKAKLTVLAGFSSAS